MNEPLTPPPPQTQLRELGSPGNSSWTDTMSASWPLPNPKLAPGVVSLPLQYQPPMIHAIAVFTNARGQGSEAQRALAHAAAYGREMRWR
jgi:hypothetical protein